MKAYILGSNEKVKVPLRIWWQVARFQLLTWTRCKRGWHSVAEELEDGSWGCVFCGRAVREA